MVEVHTGVTERINLRDATSSTGFATSLCSRQILFSSSLYCPHEPNSDALKMEEAFLSKTPEKTFHIIGTQPLFITKGHHTPFAVDWFAGHTWKNPNKWYT
jgi:hypothetical protein